jgi:hypothetical protein
VKTTKYRDVERTEKRITMKSRNITKTIVNWKTVQKTENRTRMVRKMKKEMRRISANLTEFTCPCFEQQCGCLGEKGCDCCYPKCGCAPELHHQNVEVLVARYEPETLIETRFEEIPSTKNMTVIIYEPIEEIIKYVEKVPYLVTEEKMVDIPTIVYTDVVIETPVKVQKEITEDIEREVEIEKYHK